MDKISARSNNMNTLSPTRHKRSNIQTIDPFPKIQPYSNKHCDELNEHMNEPNRTLDKNIYKSFKNAKSRDLIETTQNIYSMNEKMLNTSQSGCFYGQFSHGLSYDGRNTIKPQNANIFIEKNSSGSAERLVNDLSSHTFDKSVEIEPVPILMTQGFNAYFTHECYRNLRLNPCLNVPQYKLKPSLYEIKFSL